MQFRSIGVDPSINKGFTVAWRNRQDAWQVYRTEKFVNIWHPTKTIGDVLHAPSLHYTLSLAYEDGLRDVFYELPMLHKGVSVAMRLGECKGNFKHFLNRNFPDIHFHEAHTSQWRSEFQLATNKDVKAKCVELVNSSYGLDLRYEKGNEQDDAAEAILIAEYGARQLERMKLETA